MKLKKENDKKICQKIEIQKRGTMVIIYLYTKDNQCIDVIQLEENDFITIKIKTFDKKNNPLNTLYVGYKKDTTL